MASANEVFGELFHPGQIERVALETLRTWLPTYLAEVRRLHDYGEIAPIKSWGVVSEFDRFPEKGLPALIVMSPGTTGEPEKDGDGYYSATYTLAVAVEVAAARGDAARLIAQLYGAAVRGALLQRRSLGDEMTITDWHGEASDTVEIAQRRTRVAVENAFSVDVRQIVTYLGGPATTDPPEPPFEEWPEITDVDVEVDHLDEE